MALRRSSSSRELESNNCFQISDGSYAFSSYRSVMSSSFRFQWRFQINASSPLFVNERWLLGSHSAFSRRMCTVYFLQHELLTAVHKKLFSNVDFLRSATRSSSGFLSFSLNTVLEVASCRFGFLAPVPSIFACSLSPSRYRVLLIYCIAQNLTGTPLFCEQLNRTFLTPTVTTVPFQLHSPLPKWLCWNLHISLPILLLWPQLSSEVGVRQQPIVRPSYTLLFEITTHKPSVPSPRVLYRPPSNRNSCFAAVIS